MICLNEILDEKAEITFEDVAGVAEKGLLQRVDSHLARSFMDLSMHPLTRSIEPIGRRVILQTVS